MPTIEETPTRSETAPREEAPAGVKVLVWDLDNTLWEGTLAEGDEVVPRPGVVEVLRRLDERGILHSVASRNDAEDALSRLKSLGLADFFLVPQISWGSKAAAVRRIAEEVNVGLDTLAFVDDQPFEREEVAHVLPQVRTYDAVRLTELPELPEFRPRFVTDESRIRRRMYQADARRKTAEEEFEGADEEFLKTLGMRFSIAPCAAEDLQRAEELTVRTNQLNATGYTYSFEELDALRRSPGHLLLVADLEDRYGPYGKIGLALIEKAREKRAEVWNLKLLLMSCRVMSRGVGTLLLNHILSLARRAGVSLRAEFRSTQRNRMMWVTYRFAGFSQVGLRGDVKLLEADLERIQPPPPYVELEIVEPEPAGVGGEIARRNAR